MRGGGTNNFWSYVGMEHEKCLSSKGGVQFLFAVSQHQPCPTVIFIDSSLTFIQITSMLLAIVLLFQMVVTDVYNHRFHKVFTTDEGVSHILDKDDIFM